jgi:uncharacterized protein YnzC (UPF0291/DUF896 family)
MSHDFKEKMFLGEPISQLNPSEENKYRRYLLKQIKKSIKQRENKLKIISHEQD